MPYMIGCASQKGGPGKSTIDRALAVAFTNAGWSTKVIDLDIRQGTVTSWLRRRLANNVLPELHVQMCGSVAAGIAQASSADMIIIDGGPQATDETVAMAQAVNLLILPTGLCLDDLEPTVTLANTLVDKHAIPIERIAFALNKVGNSEVEIAAARTYLGKTRFYTLDGEIPDRPGYRTAHDLGRSIIETPYPSLNKRAGKLVQSAVDRFNALIG